MQMLKQWNALKQMDTASSSLSVSKKMTSPHMVAVIDLSLESDSWLSVGNRKEKYTEERKRTVIFSIVKKTWPRK